MIGIQLINHSIFICIAPNDYLQTCQIGITVIVNIVVVALIEVVVVVLIVEKDHVTL